MQAQVDGRTQTTGDLADSHVDAGVVRHLALFTVFAAVFALAVGILSVIGLIFAVPVLKSVVPGQPVIKMNAAVSLALCGVALWLVRRRDGQTQHRRFAIRMITGLVTVIGLVSLTEHLTGWSLGIDQALFREPLADVFPAGRSGLMAPITA